MKLLFMGLMIVALAVGTTSCSNGDQQVRTSGSNLSDDGRVRENVDDDGQMHVGANAQVDLAVFLKPSVSDGELATFISETLNRPVPGGGRLGDEYDLLPGMQSTLADYERRAVYVDFFDNATSEEREAVKQAVLASPRVERVEEGIVPSKKYPRP